MTMSTSFTLFSIAIKNLRRKPLRTAILVFAIGILVSALIFILSFVKRVDSAITATSDRLGADIILVPTGARGAAEDVLLESRVKSFYMSRSVLEKIKKVRGIDAFTEQTYLVSITGQCCDVPETVVVAFNQQTDFIITPWLHKKLGRRLQRGEALVGEESALNISVGLTDVDGILFGNIFKMVGVLDRTGTGLDTAIFIDESNIEGILTKGKSALKPGQISIVFIKVKSGADPVVVANEIEDSIIEVDTVTRKDIGRSVLSTLRDLKSVFVAAMLIVALLSVFLVWTVFSAIANERSWEIGIMRAIGAREGHISRLFFIEVLCIGCVGSVLGVAAGTTASVLIIKNFMLLKSVATDLTVPDRLLIALLSFVAGTLICVAGALSPIQRLKKLEPLLAIKEE